MARVPTTATPPPLPDMAVEEEIDPAAAVEEPVEEPVSDEVVLVTICKRTSEDGETIYPVYAGDEPEPDMGEEMAEGEEPAEGASATEFDSIGAALNEAMNIMRDDADGTTGKTPADSFNEGFNAPAAGRPGPKM